MIESSIALSYTTHYKTEEEKNIWCAHFRSQSMNFAMKQIKLSLELFFSTALKTFGSYSMPE